jgi:hypothetical protein
MTNTFYPFSPWTIEWEVLKKLNNEEKNAILQNTNVWEDAHDINIHLKKEITQETMAGGKNMVLWDFLLEPAYILKPSLQLAISKLDENTLYLLVKASNEEERKIFEENMGSKHWNDAIDRVEQSWPVRLSELTEVNKKFYNILKEIIENRKKEYEKIDAKERETKEIEAEKRDIMDLIKTRTTILSIHEERPKWVLYWNWFKISDIPDKYKNDEWFLLELIKINYDVLSIIPESFTTNIDFMYKAIKINPWSYEYASEELKKVFWNDPKMIKYLKKDHGIVSGIVWEDDKVSKPINNITPDKRSKFLKMIHNIFSKK